jgi:hypothetical protein
VSRIILPREPQLGDRTLYVPRGHETGTVVLVGVCHTCQQRFGRGQEQEWQEHVGRCAREHLDAIMHEREKKKRASVFNEDNWDPEVAAHLKKVGERMLEEGRMVLKPNERAGL